MGRRRGEAAGILQVMPTRFEIGKTDVARSAYPRPVTRIWICAVFVKEWSGMATRWDATGISDRNRLSSAPAAGSRRARTRSSFWT